MRPDFGAPLEFGDGCPVFGEVASDGPAFAAGLRTGDRLFEIGEAGVRTRRDVMAALRGVEVGAKLRVLVEREGNGLELALPVVAGGGP